MIILKAKPSDAIQIAPLFDQYRQFYKQPSDLKSAEHFVERRLSQEQSVIFYAEENQIVIGFVQLYPSFSSVRLQPLWILNDLFVSHEARRKSVARALMIHAVKFSHETGARGLTLKTAQDNQPAQKLYESLGWKCDQHFSNYDFIH